MATEKKFKKKKKVLDTWREPDKKGNVFIAEHTKDEIFIYLFLKSENRKRYLGRINKKARTLFIYRKRSEHLMMKGMTYGFNYKLFKESSRFDTVHFRDEFGSYQFTRSVVLEESEIMNFKDADDGNNYELQFFLPLKTIEQYQVESAF